VANGRHKILVVDDLSDWRTTLSGLLVDAGYDVQVADSSASALKLLETDPFALAVLDMRLDESDEDNTEGLDLAAKIKAQWPAVKVVIITGYGTPERMRQALEPDQRGQRLVVDYIPKTETEKLVAIVQHALAP
jgi:DNA-binding NtrC family response regulator